MAVEIERLPQFFEIDGKLFHSPRKIGRKLEGWLGDESSGAFELDDGKYPIPKIKEIPLSELPRT